MSAEILRQAAQHLRDEWGGRFGSAWAQVVAQNLATADWLEAEAVVLDSLEPFADAVNVAIEHTSGVKSYIEFGRTESGEIDMRAMTTPSALRLARIVLGQVAP